MSDSIPVSICIPVFNGAALIGETIASVLAQDFPGFVILIQDNASTDGTWDILTEFARRDARIQPQRNDHNLGMAGNWNVVVDRARTPLVMLLSADDMLRPGFLSGCLQAFADPSVGAVTTDHTWFTPAGDRPRRMPVAAGLRRLHPRTILLFNPFSINFTIFRRSVLDAARLQDGRVFAPDLWTCDYDLWLRLARRRLPIVYLRHPLARYRLHGANLSKQRLIMWTHTQRTLNRHLAWLWWTSPGATVFTLVRQGIRRLVLALRGGDATKT